MGSFTGWVRLNYKQWKPVVKSDTQLQCEEALVSYQSSRELTLESVVLPSGYEPNPGHSIQWQM